MQTEDTRKQASKKERNNTSIKFEDVITALTNARDEGYGHASLTRKAYDLLVLYGATITFPPEGGEGEEKKESITHIQGEMLVPYGQVITIVFPEGTHQETYAHHSSSLNESHLFTLLLSDSTLREDPVYYPEGVESMGYPPNSWGTLLWIERLSRSDKAKLGLLRHRREED